MTRIVLLIPYKFKDIDYLENKKDIPTIKIREMDDKFKVNVNNKCGCCEDKIHYINDVDNFIDKNISEKKDLQSRWYVVYDSENLYF